MFDEYARSLLVDVPELVGLTGDAAARALSRAYLALLQYRTNGPDTTEDLAATQGFLRRLANSLTFHVVLDQARAIQERQAAAFVTAEAIALQAEYISLAVVESEDKTRVFLAERFVRVESALLYLFAEYDACAAGVLRLPAPLLGQQDRADARGAVWCLAKLESLCRLSIAAERAAAGSVLFQPARLLGAQELGHDTIGRLYADLGWAVVEFTSWLRGGQNGLRKALLRLDALLAALNPAIAAKEDLRTGHDYARVFHLGTLLRLCLPAMAKRSLCHVVPIPPSADSGTYTRYLRNRAAGTGKSDGRPLLWPSAATYVRESILGDVEHAVVSMPTGSGKSFVAELAVSQAVHSGWALYLAPTNALAEQIRGDLRIGLESLQTEVFAFIGDQEYSIFRTETVAQMPTNSVAVMTPEKCALALRLAPDAFQDCALVVFDECHLLGDSGSARGPVAELVISQLMLRAPKSRFLLMSAIVQNPGDLAGWLASATGGKASPVSIRWRPTRTLRSVLGLERKSFDDASAAARVNLESLPESRKKLAFTAKCALAASLQGAWQSQAEVDYRIASIDCDASLSVSREKGRKGWRYSLVPDSWVNGAAVNLVTALANKGIQTLVFTPANRHYPFSNGSKVTLGEPIVAALPTPPALIGAIRILAEYELGCQSVVFDLLERGVAVHTSLMLEVEKIASESSFKQRCAPVMFATGTLAQGLNLPAIAVIIPGTRIGDPRGEDAHVVEQRKFSQLLNAAGRAGRAGFANQGVVITIPDKPLAFRSFSDVLNVRTQADFLQQADNAVPVGSGLDKLLDDICKEVLRSDKASDLELQVIALLAGGDDNQLEPGRLLRRTYAAYRRQQMSMPNLLVSNVHRLVQVRDSFIADTKAPDWLTVAAQRAGLDFFSALGIFSAWRKLRERMPTEFRVWSVVQWLTEFLALVAEIPPGLLERQMPRDRLARISRDFKKLTENQQELFLERSTDWEAPPEWQAVWSTVRKPLEAWMHGEPISYIAAILTNATPQRIPADRTAGKPIPSALSVTGETWSSLSLIAGGFLAVAEQILEGDVPLPLACLPMCIKYGCDSPGTLSWFRFGVRLRRVSRLLASAFPPPPNLTKDEDLRAWVHNQRRVWLNGDVDPRLIISDAEASVLNAAKAFIMS